MQVLIVGAGIAGPTLAYWLLRTGHEPTIVERAPELRTGGYVVDFWGAGFEVAERMGLGPRLHADGYRFRELREVSARGRQIAHLNPLRLIDGVSAGKYVSIARSDLARAIYDSLDGEVETIFGDTVDEIIETGDRVEVTFESGGSRKFDLVIGADGLHSRVRSLVFGPEADFERYLGITVAAFNLDDDEPREELVALTRTQVGLQTLRVPVRDGSTLFCIMFRHDGEVPTDDVLEQKAFLCDRLQDVGGDIPSILGRLPQARDFYMDRASQIRMPSWSHEKVALIGDAAACPSLLAGQGSALAMVEAYILAAALHEAGDNFAAAFRDYQNSLRTLVLAKQDAAIGLGVAFAPRNSMQLLFRNLVMSLMGIPIVARFAIGRSLRDPISLPPLGRS